MREIVKYHNDLNTVGMRQWEKEEMNFFFAIIAKAKEKGSETINFSTDELKELSQFANRHKQRWADTMENVARKVMKLTYIEKTQKKIKVMVLFQTFEVDFAEKTVKVKLHSDFEYILNQLQANFTVWELEQFTQIRSTYAKTMYRLLKQYRSTGYFKISAEDFNHILGVPKSYKPGDIDRRILQPIQEQLSLYFEELKINKVKAKTRGNPVTGLEFSFKPETVKKRDKEENKQQETPKTADNDNHRPVPFYNWLEE